jgi:hypothetical protein
VLNLYPDLAMGLVTVCVVRVGDELNQAAHNVALHRIAGIYFPDTAISEYERRTGMSFP